MRHRVVGRKLKRTASHRRSLLRSLSTELIRHKRITTTEAKAKEAVRFVEAIISRAKRAYLAERDGGPANLHARRIIGRDIQDRSVVRELFTNVAPKVAERPGGYTRVIRIGRRNGDGAEMAVLELVDYNLEQDENAVRSRSKKLMSRAERVRRSQEKQKQQTEETPSGEAGAATGADIVDGTAPEETDAVVETQGHGEVIDEGATVEPDSVAGAGTETSAEGEPTAEGGEENAASADEEEKK